MADETDGDGARLMWDLGDYGPTSRKLEPASVALVAAIGVDRGHALLDVAAGHGNCAVAAARRGATVTATDRSPAMIAAGRARTERTGLDISWQEADAMALPFDDASFDRVTSVFGAIFAPEPQRVAGELVRVLRPGGVGALTAWTPDGLAADLDAIDVHDTIGAPDADSTDGDVTARPHWGRPTDVGALFASLDCTVDIRRRTLTMHFASWDEWRHAIEAHGMSVVARRTMEPEAYARLQQRVEEVTAAHNHGEGAQVAYDHGYLEIVVTRPR